MIRRMLLGSVMTIGILLGGPVAAQDAPALVEYYGDGVHAYFEGDVFDAHRLLTQAIDGGIQDPRAYYFRAMTLLRMGRHPEAEADMQAGAYLEARAPGGAYDVDRSIQRIQGRHRLLLEKIRRQVRFNVQQQRQEEATQRYEQTRQREAEVLRRQRPGVYDEAIEPTGGRQDAPGPDTPRVPQGPGAAEQPPQRELPRPGTAAPPTDTPQSPAGDAPPAQPQPDSESESDPFGTPQPPEQPAEQPADDDPFGGAFDTSAGSAVPDDDARVADANAGAATEPAIEVGQKVAPGKLIEVIGGLLGGVVDDTVSNVAGNIPGTIGPSPLGPGAGPAPSMEAFGPGDDDPFGGDPIEGAADPFGGAGDAEDPFGGGADPFGAEAEAAPDEDGEDGEDPFAGDPFGNTTSEDTGAGDPFASEPVGGEAGPADDPFGDAGANPFE